MHFVIEVAIRLDKGVRECPGPRKGQWESYWHSTTRKMSVECKDTCTRTQATHTHTQHNTYFIWNESFSLNLRQLPLTASFRIKHFTLVMRQLFNSWRLNTQLFHDARTTFMHTHMHHIYLFTYPYLDQCLTPIAGLASVWIYN